MIAIFKATLVVFLFECRRTIVVARVLIGIGLAAFPIGLIALIKSRQTGTLEDPFYGTMLLFWLIPGLTCMMSLLLWAVPAIHADVEGRIWPYLAVRPGGKQAVLLGKYLAAVTWTVVVGLLSMTVSLYIMRPAQTPLQTWAALAGIVTLSSMSYGSLFVLIGVVFLRRAMVVAVAYALLVEFITAFVPAVIHQFTIQYHLRSLLSRWTTWKLPIQFQLEQNWFFSDAPAWQHYLVLIGFTIAALIATVVILRQRELVKPEED